MYLSRPNAKEHGEVALLLGGVYFKLVDVDNIIVLCFRLEAVLALIATETTKDEASLFFTTHFDEPAG
ncbi:hypothetical protein MKX07_008773 [Trichoderma sp. CBMAI-0711]|nr:hypothetical protein MKX07_008773 [Trichoderma sp. CBMAI-0711]